LSRSSASGLIKLRISALIDHSSIHTAGVLDDRVEGRQKRIGMLNKSAPGRNVHAKLVLRPSGIFVVVEVENTYDPGAMRTSV
jgi:hypothetical protein